MTSSKLACNLVNPGFDMLHLLLILACNFQASERTILTTIFTTVTSTAMEDFTIFFMAYITSSTHFDDTVGIERILRKGLAYERVTV